jgi:precorrin-6A/cobalt-precorrin-6A reductase
MSDIPLILGGTAEARVLTRRLAEMGRNAIYSYAGRTEAPHSVPVPSRIGGFGGVEGLARYLEDARITHLIDATHPFADTMSRNAIAASRETGVPLIALVRPAWQSGPGDAWTHVPDIEAAIAAFPAEPKRIFLAIGRTEVGRFAARPEHVYLLRFVDPPATLPPLPHHEIVLARGPFDSDEDRALLERHEIELVVSKNSGGEGARAKLDAARALGLPVLMIDRPTLPPRHEVATVDDVMDWLDHSPTLRGV